MEKIQALIQPLIDQFEGHPYLQAGVVVVGTFILARTFAWLLVLLFKAFTSRTRTALDDVVFEWLRTPLVYTLLMFGLSLATRLLPVSAHLAGILISILQTLGVVVWMVFFVHVTKLFLTRQADNTQALPFIQPATLPLFRNVAFILIVVAGLYVIFSIWGIDMTAWMASAGILGIAVGFAAKDTLANLFSGVFILADMPYKIGDYVVLDSGERG
ncbi:MAG TPA: mechanosensitive ion channel, partial [Gammaproteobacteria bacterium]|nr:mechanosensitive ion channel [Gammaproteobacteria bacterium]